MRAWAPLDSLAEGHPLRLFKTGLEHLEQEDHEACMTCLSAGIDANPKARR